MNDPMTLHDWLLASFDDNTLMAILQDGADAGWEGLTRTNDTLALYRHYRGDIWAVLCQLCKREHCQSVPAFIAKLTIAKAMKSDASFKHQLVLFSVEQLIAWHIGNQIR